MGGGEDRRHGPKSTPHNKLTQAEEDAVVEVVKSTKYADLSPRQLVPLLACDGVYLASEPTFYRIMHRRCLICHRQRSRPPVARPRALTATGPGQVLSWDITYLRSTVRGSFYYLYVIVDVWSRMIVGAEVHEVECGIIAGALIQSACINYDESSMPMWLHSDNGAPMRSAHMLAKLQRLGISPSFSRPRTSNDNPYSESLFRTLKYRPSYPSRPFASLEAARAWVERFVRWYNEEHRHSAINYVTPQERHEGRHIEVLAQRKRVYEAARARHPERWSGAIRNCDPIDVVCLNPERAANQALKKSA
jgi:transposase InsO family protein